MKTAGRIKSLTGPPGLGHGGNVKGEIIHPSSEGRGVKPRDPPGSEYPSSTASPNRDRADVADVPTITAANVAASATTTVTDVTVTRGGPPDAGMEAESANDDVTDNPNGNNEPTCGPSSVGDDITRTPSGGQETTNGTKDGITAKKHGSTGSPDLLLISLHPRLLPIPILRLPEEVLKTQEWILGATNDDDVTNSSNGKNETTGGRSSDEGDATRYQSGEQETTNGTNNGVTT